MRPVRLFTPEEKARGLELAADDLERQGLDAAFFRELAGLPSVRPRRGEPMTEPKAPIRIPRRRYVVVPGVVSTPLLPADDVTILIVPRRTPKPQAPVTDTESGKP